MSVARHVYGINLPNRLFPRSEWHIIMFSGFYFDIEEVAVPAKCFVTSSLKSQVVLLQTAHSWANAGVLLGACMHRERGSFRSN